MAQTVHTSTSTLEHWQNAEFLGVGKPLVSVFGNVAKSEFTKYKHWKYIQIECIFLLINIISSMTAVTRFLCVLVHVMQ